MSEAIDAHRPALVRDGLDSATCLLIATQQEGFEVFALSFDYGQRHRVELERARPLAARYGAREHRVVRLDLPARAASALTDPSQGRPAEQSRRGTHPGHLRAGAQHALSRARPRLGRGVGAGDIFIGANALDYSGYPDCRPEFLEAFERMANLGTKAGVEGKLAFRIHAPLLQMTKAQIVARAAELGLDFGLTSSCYDPSAEGVPCGACDSCLLREKGFREAGIADPLAKLLVLMAYLQSTED